MMSASDKKLMITVLDQIGLLAKEARNRIRVETNEVVLLEDVAFIKECVDKTFEALSSRQGASAVFAAKVKATERTSPVVENTSLRDVSASNVRSIDWYRRGNR